MSSPNPIFRVAPYPYRALFAICSDLDKTPSRKVYEDTTRFLNTDHSVGAMGQGVGLEVGNTMYFHMPAGQFSYWNADDMGREMIRTLIRSGHIDCFHSYGDLATTRSYVEKALDDLSRHGCAIGVWIDHAIAVTNFGADIMLGAGDIPGHAAYHADLTLAHGVRYVWLGRVTSVIGQDVPRGFAGLYRSDHRFESSRTVLMEWVKGMVGRLGSAKYSMHARNDLIRPVRLRDGQAAWEFFRTNPYWKSVALGERAQGFGHVLTEQVLDALCARGGSAILYTHLGKVTSHDEPLPSHTRDSLRRLAAYQDAGKILVATTRRVLDHALVRRLASVDVRTEAGRCQVALNCPAALVEAPLGDPRCGLSGLTIYVPRAGAYEMSLNGAPVSTFSVNPPDETGRPTVSLPWPRLQFPALPA